LSFEMWNDFLSGRLPVPNLANLDVYHELGLDANADGVSARNNVEDLMDVYRTRLERLHELRPMQADGRLWNGGVEEDVARSRASYA
jgi:hypothetical protein